VTAPVFRLDPLPDEPVLSLTGDEARHAASVRRLRAGERVDVTDGRGTLAEGVVVTAERDRLDVRVGSRRQLPAPQPRLVVLQALVKGDRSELAVELLTELGVDEIVPWEAERCVARWAGERTARRWAATAAAAAKQSRRVHWPVVADVVRTDGAVRRLAAADLAVVLSEDATEPLRGRTVPVGTGEVVLVVGPEGGISDAERAAFAAAGAASCLLGPTVLRASTAGAAAAAVLLAATGRW
jgi:16S rRNA (uracil1498-N3)-methyltransferase